MTAQQKGNLLLRYLEEDRLDLQKGGTGVDFTNLDFSGSILVDEDLSGVFFCGINLNNAILTGCDFSEADLTTANLREVDCSNADFSEANLSSADLTGAVLRGADFNECDLSMASLRDADLRDADLTESDLSDAELSFNTKLHGCKLGWTILAGLDLGPFCRSWIQHLGPSVVDHVSIFHSIKEPKLIDFLFRSGMPIDFAKASVESARTISRTSNRKLFQSTFISYGGPDEGFAEKLYQALKTVGVQTYFFKRHATPGEKLHRHIHRRIHEYNRMILVCSRYSLDRPGVLYEIETILAREAKEGGSTRLIPVSLDNYLLNGWNPPDRPDLRSQLLSRVVADFTGTDTDEAMFQAQFHRLLGALKADR